MQEKQQTNVKQENIIIELLSEISSVFGPLFLGILIVFLLIAWTYLKYTTPVYEVSAKLIVKDEKKGC